MKKYLLILCILLPSLVMAQAKRGVQPTNDPVASGLKKGNTYALIIGINYVNRKNFPSLHYAVDDAQLLKTFLQSGSFFDSLADKNIKFIADKDATAANLWYGFDWLTKIANKGDNAIIYFAGHGIASGPSLAFLIAYDAPDISDPAGFGFQGGAIPVSQLKDYYIGKLDAKGVTTFLITDACRNNERSDSSNYNFQDIIESNKGEIQFSSCSRNQSSMEDKKWGGGHGLFTYYLIKGLNGEADEDKDQHVTLNELDNYLKKHVEDDSRDLVTNKPQQIPYINLSNAPDQEATIAFVKPNKKITDQLKEEDMLDIVKTRGFDDTSTLFKLYEDALDKHLFFDEQEGNAGALLAQIKKTSSADDYDDAVQQYIIHLLNDAQQRINKYFEGVDTNYTANYFSTGARELNVALGFMSKEHPLYKIYNVNRLFMEARSLRESFSSYILADIKIDSAIAIDSSLSYLYHAKGLIASDQREWKDAIYFFKKAHALKPDWWFPQAELASCYLALNEDSKAKNIYWEAVTSDPLNPAKWNTLGVFFDNRRLYDSALACYQKAVLANPGYTYSLRNMANIYAAQNKNELANKIYWQAIDADSLNANTWNDLGAFYFNRKNYDSAITCYKKAIQIFPSFAVSFRNLGNLYKMLNDKIIAKRMFYKAVNLDPLNADNWNDLGVFYTVQSNYDSAIVCYDKAISIDPNYSLSIRNLADVYKGLHKYKLADRLFWLAVYRDSSNSYNWNELGKFFEDKNVFDSAVFCYKKSISLDPGNSILYRSIASLYRKYTRYDSARRWIISAIQQQPLDPNNWNDLGVYYMNLNFHDSAITAYKKAIAIDPNYSLAIRNIGGIYALDKNDSMAAIMYWKAVRADSLNADNWNQLGVFYHNKGNYDTAIIFYKKAIAIDPYYSLTLRNIGLLYQNTLKDTLAEKFYRIAIKADPLEVKNWNTLAQFYYDTKSYDSAKRYYKTSVTIDTAYLAGYYYIGFINLYQNNDSDALNYFLKDIAIDTNYAFGYYGIGRVYMDKKDYPTAINYFLKAVKLDSVNTDFFDYTGYAYTYNNQFDKGHYYFKKTIALDTANYDGYYNEACAYSRAGDKAKGFAFLELSLQKGFKDEEHIKTDDDIVYLRTFPEFGELLKKYFP